MMDGKNCTGRKISLLNDSSDVAEAAITTTNTSKHHAAGVQLPPLLHSVSFLSAHSRTSSCSTTPSLSPQTPQLSRSTSSDSRGLGSPSPLTPSFAASFDHHYAQRPHHHHHQSLPTLGHLQRRPSHHQQYYLVNHAAAAKMDDPSQSMYPPIPDATNALASAYALPPQQIPQLIPQQQQHILPPQSQQNASQQSAHQNLYRSSTSPTSEPSRTSNASTNPPNNKQPQQKKNQYPCPMAKQVGCTDFFTTSGHAARHAKKHTGKKDAFCPECNKAFTRKDNMEQHRRTHQNGRGASRTVNDDNKVKKPAKQPSKKPSLKPDSMLEAAVEQQLAEQQQQNQPILIPSIQQVQPQITMPMQAVTTIAPQLALATDQVSLMGPAGPYFLGTMDTGPTPALPLVPDFGMRPPLHRSSFNSSLEYVPPVAPMLTNPDDLHYSYPSPGLSHGLNSLALAASEHRRMSEEKAQSDASRGSSSPGETPSQETP